MRLLLTQPFVPREHRTPIPLMDLATYGRKHGHDVTVGYTQDAGEVAGDYDVVGVSALLFNQETRIALLNLRRRYAGRIVLGGKATTTLQHNDFTLAESLGVEVFCGNGEQFFAPQLPYSLEDYPAWDERDFRLLDKGMPLMTEMMSSRGCPYHCHFCHNTEPRVQHFSVERIIANAQLILGTMQRNRVFLVDDTFSLSARRMTAILEAADSIGLDLRDRTCFFIHIDHIDAGRLAVIDAYRPAEMLVGIESGDDGMLEAMGKTFTAAEAEQRLRTMHAHGRYVACLFLLGFPGETRASLQATVDFVTRNRQYMSGWWASYYQPIPFTKGWELARERLGRTVNGNWNTDIAYIDPNLTEDDLVAARRDIMQD